MNDEILCVVALARYLSKILDASLPFVYDAGPLASLSFDTAELIAVEVRRESISFILSRWFSK